MSTIYRNQYVVTKNTQPNHLKYHVWCSGWHGSADTLEGIKRLVNEHEKQTNNRLWWR